MDMSFALAYWLLANEYFQISRIMPYVLKEGIVPQSMIRFDRIVNCIMIGLIVVFTASEGVTDYFIWFICISQQKETAMTW